MAKYELDDIKKNNLIEFLKRVQLSGAEVPAFNDILLALNKPIKDIVEDSKE
jgi:hypothetical protein